MQIVIHYQSKVKTKKLPAKRLAKESYPSFAAPVVDIFTMEKLVAVAKKLQIQVASVCSDTIDTMLKGDASLVLDFLWDKIYNECME